MSNFRDSMTLVEARDALRPLVEVGHRCPCCHQFAKVYRRKIHSKMARELITCWRAAGVDWFHMPDVVERGGDVAKLRYWSLLQLSPDEEATWRVTARGRAFVVHRARVQKYARIYDGRCLGLTGDFVSIEDCLGERFSYQELMAGV